LGGGKGFYLEGLAMCNWRYRGPIILLRGGANTVKQRAILCNTVYARLDTPAGFSENKKEEWLQSVYM